MFKSVLLKTLRDFVKPFFYFFIGIFLISLLVMYVIAEIPLVEFEAILGDLPKIITAIVGGHSILDLTSVEGVLNTDVFSIIAPVIVIGLGVFSGISATANEEEKRTLEIILSLPIGRKKFLIEKMISLIIKVFLVGFIFWFSFWRFNESNQVFSTGSYLRSDRRPLALFDYTIHWNNHSCSHLQGTLRTHEKH